MQIFRFDPAAVVAIEALPLMVPQIRDEQVREILRDQPFRFERRGLFHWATGDSINKFFNLKEFSNGSTRSA